MELKQIDLLQLEPNQASFARFSEVRWPTIHFPSVGAGTLKTCFGGDHQILRVGVQRLGD